jgi:hypothetical protein
MSQASKLQLQAAVSGRPGGPQRQRLHGEDADAAYKEIHEGAVPQASKPHFMSIAPAAQLELQALYHMRTDRTQFMR